MGAYGFDGGIRVLKAHAEAPHLVKNGMNNCQHKLCFGCLMSEAVRPGGSWPRASSKGVIERGYTLSPKPAGDRVKTPRAPLPDGPACRAGRGFLRQAKHVGPSESIPPDAGSIPAASTKFFYFWGNLSGFREC